MLHINCRLFVGDGCCSHPHAPQPMFGMPSCILVRPVKDPRVPPGCRVQGLFKVEKPAPLMPPVMPPNTRTRR